jgi:hypothetical protein
MYNNHELLVLRYQLSGVLRSLDCRKAWSSRADYPMEPNLPTGGQYNASAQAKLPINGWSRSHRPCDACRRRKSRCIIPQDTDACIMCQSRSEECTFVQNPQRRKRRRAEDETSPDATKPRYSCITLQRQHRADCIGLGLPILKEVSDSIQLIRRCLSPSNVQSVLEHQQQYRLQSVANPPTLASRSPSISRKHQDIHTARYYTLSFLFSRYIPLTLAQAFIPNLPSTITPPSLDLHF